MPCCNKWPIQNGMYSVVWDLTICWLMAFTQLALKCNILSPNIQYIISYHIQTYIWIICTYTYNWHYVYSVIVVVVYSFLKDTNNCECKIFHGNICDIKTHVQNIASVGYMYIFSVYTSMQIVCNWLHFYNAFIYFRKAVKWWPQTSSLKFKGFIDLSDYMHFMLRAN